MYNMQYLKTANLLNTSRIKTRSIAKLKLYQNNVKPLMCTHMHVSLFLSLSIYEQETSVHMSCTVIKAKNKVCLMNFCILLILSHVCEW